MSAEQDPDAALMLRVKQGDSSAFSELVDKYNQPVMNLAQRMLRDPAEAEDLSQNVFVQVYKSAHRYQVSSKFSTWPFTIARNLCLNEIRRRSRHPAECVLPARFPARGHWRTCRFRPPSPNPQLAQTSGRLIDPQSKERLVPTYTLPPGMSSRASVGLERSFAFL